MKNQQVAKSLNVCVDKRRNVSASETLQQPKHRTINTYKWTHDEQTVPWVFLSNVRLHSASDTSKGQAGQGGITNDGIIPGVQYVAVFTAGCD